MNQKRPNTPAPVAEKKQPDTIQVPSEAAVTAQVDTIEVTPVKVEPEKEPAKTPAPAPATTPEPVQRAPSEGRIVALRERLNRFPDEFPTNKAMTPTELTAMVRFVETTMNILFSATTSSEAAAMLTAIRAALHENKGNAFASERILGRMIEPRSGRLLVSNERTMAIMSLLYLTANPALFKAQKGRIDVSSSVKGMPSDIATFIIEYFS